MGEVEHVAPPNESQMGRVSKTQGLGGRPVSHGLEGRPCNFILVRIRKDPEGNKK